jgi:hypothetical protein
VSEKSPVLLDRFLDDAIEVDVDCIADGSDGADGVMIGGIMEHARAGRHPLRRLGLLAAAVLAEKPACRTSCAARPS